MCALRVGIVSMDKILHFTNSFIIIIAMANAMLIYTYRGHTNLSHWQNKLISPTYNILFWQNRLPQWAKHVTFCFDKTSSHSGVFKTNYSSFPWGPRADKCSPFRGQNIYGHACFTHCQEFLLCPMRCMCIKSDFYWVPFSNVFSLNILTACLPTLCLPSPFYAPSHV